MIDLTRRTLVTAGAAFALPGAARAESLPWDLPPLRKVQIDVGEIIRGHYTYIASLIVGGMTPWNESGKIGTVLL